MLLKQGSKKKNKVLNYNYTNISRIKGVITIIITIINAHILLELLKVTIVIINFC